MPVLSPGALNRATLARQHLLERVRRPLPEMLDHLVGLQAQSPEPPYWGLWTRLQDFRPESLSEALAARTVVRLALMRSTIHLVTAADAARLRPAVQRALGAGPTGAVGAALSALGPDRLRALDEAARELLARAPLPLPELGARLSPLAPGVSPAAIAYALRARLPLVQPPPRGLWRRGGPATVTTLEAWTGQALDTSMSQETLVRRYLAAFGPASVQDAARWSGLSGLGATVSGMREGLIEFQDADGRTLWDLPEAPRPDAATPAPVRFLPEFDNVLLAHAERGRHIAPRHTAAVYQGGMIRSVVLVDGRVRGVWTLRRGLRATVVRVALLDRTSRRDRTEIQAEGEHLARTAMPEARAHVVTLEDA